MLLWLFSYLYYHCAIIIIIIIISGNSNFKGEDLCGILLDEEEEEQKSRDSTRVSANVTDAVQTPVVLDQYPVSETMEETTAAAVSIPVRENSVFRGKCHEKSLYHHAQTFWSPQHISGWGGAGTQTNKQLFAKMIDTY